VAVREAEAALWAEIASAKAADPLAPVTVVTPTTYAALVLRARLVRARRGLVNASFTVLERLGEHLGAPVLAGQGRLPLDPVVWHGAVMAAMAERGGAWLAGSARAASVRAVAARLREVRRAGPSDGGNGSLAGLLADVRERTAAWYDDEDSAVAAASVVRDRQGPSRAVEELGQVVVYLPGELLAGGRDLIDALVQAGRAVVIEGAHDGTEDGAGVRADRLIVAPDADVEARVVVQELIGLMQNGTPLSRTALLYRQPDPYARALLTALGQAGLPVAGPGVDTLAQTVSGRTLLALIALENERFSRTAVMSLLNGAPVRETQGPGLAPVEAWEGLARSAHVVDGPPRWEARLRVEEERLGQAASRRRERGEDTASLERRIASSERLRRFVADLVELTVGARPVAGASWRSWAQWAGKLLERYLGPESAQSQGDRARVGHAIERLGALDGLTPGPDAARFGTALEVALASSAGRLGRFGDGVFVGPASSVEGAAFDAVFLVGMAESQWPPRRADDALAPVGPAGRRHWRAEERRLVLGLTGSAGLVVLSRARADRRSGQPYEPSPWWEEARDAGARLLEVPSLTAAMARQPLCEEDVVADALDACTRAGGAVSEHPLVVGNKALSRGLACVTARTGAGLTPWEGLVGRHPALYLEPGRALSPTALEQWALCPRRYLLSNVLGVAETERPEDMLELSALHLGSLVHEALEDFFKERAAAGALGEEWTPADVERLVAVLRRHAASAEAQGLTGKPVPWAHQRRRLEAALRGFLVTDRDRRAADRLVPLAFEIGFGLGQGDDEQGPVEHALAERTLRFRGRIDRIDANKDRSVVSVVDYKTGRAERYRPPEDDPMDGGRRLQLPVYALAAQEQFPGATVQASYWFLTDPAPPVRVALDDKTMRRFDEVVGAIADGIEDGLFLANPGEEAFEGWENCRFCPFDRVCPSDRDEIYGRTSADPNAAPYLRLSNTEHDGGSR